jgi:hypothetical protein
MSVLDWGKQQATLLAASFVSDETTQLHLRVISDFKERGIAAFSKGSDGWTLFSG